MPEESDNLFLELLKRAQAAVKEDPSMLVPPLAAPKAIYNFAKPAFEKLGREIVEDPSRLVDIPLGALGLETEPEGKAGALGGLMAIMSPVFTKKVIQKGVPFISKRGKPFKGASSVERDLASRRDSTKVAVDRLTGNANSVEEEALVNVLAERYPRVLAHTNAV